MEYLPLSNLVQEGDLDASPIDANGKHVVIIGGGDTGADCLGTAHRQGAASVTQLEILPRPPDDRAAGNPWPQWSFVYRVSSAHEEGGERMFSVNTEHFVDDGDGNVRGVAAPRGRDDRRAGSPKIEGTEREIPAELVLLAMGFVGPEQVGVARTARRRVRRTWQRPARRRLHVHVPGVFVAGDMGRGQSLIVWAIAEGRACAAAVDRFLVGETTLPAPVLPTTRPLM